MGTLTTHKQAHIAILPFAQQGHINPLMQLAKKLAQTGARVTFAVPDSMVPSTEGKTPNLHIVGVADNLPPERSKGSSFRDSIDSMLNLQAGFRELLQHLCDEPNGVSALIYDAFMSWAPDVASSLSLPYICFFTSNATSGALLYEVPSLAERGVLPFRQGNLSHFLHIAFTPTDMMLGTYFLERVPQRIGLFSRKRELLNFDLRLAGLLSQKGKKNVSILMCLWIQADGDGNAPLSKEVVRGMKGVPDLLPEEFLLPLTFEETHAQYQFVMKLAKSLLSATAIILNTMEELEPDAISALRAQKPVFPIGPLLLLSGRPSRLDVNYWPEDDRCLPWLDSHPPSSVLYVSFGSIASLPLSHFQQLALGLEASNQPFLWVVRPNSIDIPLEQALPEGFLARTKDRGLIITWGPQLLILSHPSIGGFLSHGGWNSMVENLSTGSVPMICWPHAADQRLNRRLMEADYWGLGLRLQHEKDESVAKEEITRVIQELLQGEHGKELKRVASKVGDIAKRAVAKGGSSQRNFEALHNYITLHDHQ